MRTCPPTLVSALSFRIDEEPDFGWTLLTYHAHAGTVGAQCPPEVYSKLTWAELEDLVENLLFAYQPGNYPLAVAQERLPGFSQ